MIRIGSAYSMAADQWRHPKSGEERAVPPVFALHLPQCFRYDVVMGRSNLIRALLDRALERGLGETIAVREPKRAWSYARLFQEACRAGSALRSLGIKPGERIALLLHDSGDLAASFLGALRIGAVPTPLNLLLRPLEVRALLRDSSASAIVTSADLSGAVDAVRGELPDLRHVLAVGGARPGHEDFHALAREAEAECAVADPGELAPAFLLYSAGAGSRPKGVPQSHEAALHAFAAYGEAIIGLNPADRVFSTAKLSSAYGLGLGLLFPLMAGASTFLLPNRPRPRTIFDVMVAFRPTVFAATPSLYAQMVNDYQEVSPPRPACFQAVRHAISGGEGLPATLEERIRATFGIDVLHGFGTTEALHFVCSNQPGATRAGSVGRPLDGIEARVVGEDGAPLAVEEIGLIELRGATVARGYFHAHDGQEVFHEGWVRPGDRFFVDTDGYYFYCGRADDLFKVSGRWVAPDEVERTLLTHPAVWECAVVEGHDDLGLPRPVAFVVPNIGHAPSEALAIQLMEFVKNEIAPYKYPREVAFVESLPKSAAGRVLRWRLRQGRVGDARGLIRPR
jgi:benzoate-CoA ligase